jgi:hypothetical protein
MTFRRRLTGLRDRIGRRGSSLLFLAWLDLIYGIGLLVADAAARATPTYAFIAKIAPLGWWAVVWFVVGAVCLAQAAAARDQFAFGLAVCLKITWGGMTLVGWLLHDVPRGYVSAAIWLAFGAWLFIISGWPERDPEQAPGRTGRWP